MVSEVIEDEPPPPPRAHWRWGWRKAVLAAVLGVIGLALLAAAVINSPIGHRFIADSIARYAPASGLRIRIGRIEGSLLGTARLHDVTLADPQGVFLRVPEAELDWRPMHWFTSGLDVRELSAHRGVLLRVPKLNPGNPDAPLLPDFDIRIDKLVLDHFIVAKGIAGPARRVDLKARADIRKGRAYLKVLGRFDGRDRLDLLLDAEPARNRLAINGDYDAPRGGVLAALVGATHEIRARLVGKGDWRQWDGALLIEQERLHLAALKLGARSGRYSVLGQIRPDGLIGGAAHRALGDVAAVDASATLARSAIDGRIALTGGGLRTVGQGKVDLAGNRFDGFELSAVTTDPGLLGGDVRLDAAKLTARLDGGFRDLAADYRLSARQLAIGAIRIEQPAGKGIARREGTRWTVPVNLAAARVLTGNAVADRKLVAPRLTATLTLDNGRLASRDMALVAPGLTARLALAADLARGGYAVAGPVVAQGLALPDVGTIDGRADIVFRIGARSPWWLQAKAAGRMTRTDNATIAALAGTGLRFSGELETGGAQPLLIRRARLDGSKLSLTLGGRVLPGGTTSISGQGRHADYGPFTVQAQFAKDGPHAALVFADPLPAAGLSQVHVALAPISDGLRIETDGGSALGPFKGALALYMAPGAPTRIEIEQMNVANTQLSGGLVLAGGGADGVLTLAGGGLDGTLRLGPRSGGQGFDIALTARNARFAGDRAIGISRGKLNASGHVSGGRLALSGNLLGGGISYGDLFIGRIAAKAEIADGRGTFNATLAGRRGSRFNLQLLGEAAPDRLAVVATGNYAGSAIAMPRRAVLTREDGGWRLAPTEIDFDKGRMIASGLIGNSTELQLAMADIPLTVADIAVSDLGLGGTASGIVDYRHTRGALATGDARLIVKGLTRSGLLLTSRPIDLALVARLDADDLQARVVLRENGTARGRMQARIANLPADGSLGERLNRGNLFAQLRYAGPADALWRLIALEGFDITGPIEVAANASGSLGAPRIDGSLASDDATVQSVLTGSRVEHVRARGGFAGSRLVLSTLSGEVPGGGSVVGSGTIDFTDLATRPPAIDLKLAAHNAQLIDRDDLAATVTGPLRIVSDGRKGTIAGRLTIDRARWQLGQAEAAELPSVRTQEINLPSDIAPQRTPATVWRYLIDARGSDRIVVRGMGLDSVWGANVQVRGTTATLAITGRADLVRGSYEFAGKSFDMTRGIIRFNGESPPNPQLDIAAEADVTGLTAKVTVTGSALVPTITFTSTPALPEEELLSRLLFGDSITQISAPEALQLAAALASLRGGGGLDPINKLRSSIGLDRLRIVSADPTIGRSTAISAGKYLGRKFYAEIITDGRGYSATQVEFRITSWLSLLSSVSTLGQESLNVKVSKDY
jgi:translocation and assembly module TamB